jgi:hypothetical protein
MLPVTSLRHIHTTLSQNSAGRASLPASRALIYLQELSGLGPFSLNAIVLVIFGIFCEWAFLTPPHRSEAPCANPDY